MKHKPPWTLETISQTIPRLNRPELYADIVHPPDEDNEVMHVIRRRISLYRNRVVPQELLVIGSKHRTDHSHWYYEDYAVLMDEWERRTRDVNQRVIIREGADPFWGGLGGGLNEIDPIENISEGSDGGLATTFSKVHDIPVIGGDFPYYGDIVAQATLNPERIEEILTYYTMREIPIYARLTQLDDTLETFLKQRLAILRRSMGKLAITTFVPDTLDFSYDTMVDLHKKFFDGQEPTLALTDTYLKYTSANLEDKEFQQRKVARIAIDRMKLSDAHLLLTIEHQLKQERDVMTIFGNHHTMAICGELGKYGVRAALPEDRSRGYGGRQSWSQRPTKEFQDSMLIYPSEEAIRRSKGSLLSLRRPDHPKAQHLNKYEYVWPSLRYERDPSPLQHNVEALLTLETARRFEGNRYITNLCREPLEWKGDLLELFQMLEHEGESIRQDPELLGKNHDISTYQDELLTYVSSTEIGPSLQKVLLNAQQRLKDIFGSDTQGLSKWFDMVSAVVTRECYINQLPVEYAVDRENMITKQVVGLCKLFRTNAAFLELGLSAWEQCSYALSFLDHATQKDFWPLQRLDRIVKLPYHILPAYKDYGERLNRQT